MRSAVEAENLNHWRIREVLKHAPFKTETSFSKQFRINCKWGWRLHRFCTWQEIWLCHLNSKIFMKLYFFSTPAVLTRVVGNLHVQSSIHSRCFVGLLRRGLGLGWVVWLSKWAGPVSLYHLLMGPQGVGCQHRRWWFYPWVRKTPWRRKWQPTPVFLPGKSHGQRSLAGFSPWGCKRVRCDLETKQQNQNEKTICKRIYLYLSIYLSISIYLSNWFTLLYTWNSHKL